VQNGREIIARNSTLTKEDIEAIRIKEKAEEVIIYGPVGLQYYPELTTESGITIITEDGKIILLG
jgi:uncharacterized protein (DUF4213/DUF364 family)